MQVHRRHSASLDTVLIIIGLIAAILSYALLSISTTTAMIYACKKHVYFVSPSHSITAGGLQFISSMMSPGFRAFIPKLVQKHETGMLYTSVFKRTIQQMLQHEYTPHLVLL
jgi:hypothetical protein